MCILNVGRSTGGEELCAVVYVRRLERNLSVVRNGAVGNGDDRGGGGNIPIVDGFYASSESVKVGPKPGNQGFGNMSEATAVIHEATAVIEQFIVEASGSGVDVIGGSCNATVHVAEGAISRRDTLNCRADLLIQGVDAWAERLECLETVVQGIETSSDDAIIRHDALFMRPDTLV